jgi:hypothetical protein
MLHSYAAEWIGARKNGSTALVRTRPPRPLPGPESTVLSRYATRTEVPHETDSLCRTLSRHGRARTRARVAALQRDGRAEPHLAAGRSMTSLSCGPLHFTPNKTERQGNDFTALAQPHPRHAAAAALHCHQPRRHRLRQRLPARLGVGGRVTFTGAPCVFRS